MPTLLHGENNPVSASSGFILLRGLLVMFIVIICFAAVTAALAVISRHDVRLLENTLREIDRKNAAVLLQVR